MLTLVLATGATPALADPAPRGTFDLYYGASWSPGPGGDPVKECTDGEYGYYCGQQNLRSIHNVTADGGCTAGRPKGIAFDISGAVCNQTTAGGPATLTWKQYTESYTGTCSSTGSNVIEYTTVADGKCRRYFKTDGTTKEALCVVAHCAKPSD